MAALSFQKQFVTAILCGLHGPEYVGSLVGMPVVQPKRQTIRQLRKDGRDPNVGDTLYLYTGMRTKGCQKLGEVTCLFVIDVEIAKNGMLTVEGKANSTLPFYKRLADEYPDLNPKEAIARLDGFKDWAEMQAWFAKTHHLPFKGKLIGW